MRSTVDLPPASGEADARRLGQQLQLYRIELEMQREELRRARDELKASRALVDQRVLARTAQLTRTIEDLSQEVRVRSQAQQSLLGACDELELLRARLRAENASLHLQLARFELEDLPGPSPALAGLRSRIEAAAVSENPVLLLGEAGTGKRTVARAVHHRGERRHRTLLITSCAAPEEELEVMLFGQSKAGTDYRRIGQFELAAQGTLFLDEIASLPLPLQATLVGAIRQFACLPMGSPAGARVEVKLIAASNRDLQEEVRQGRFRQDLYDCLSGCPVRVPPLREHREDIPALAALFIARFNRTLGRSVATLPAPALARLMARSWPGNLRELEGVIELAMIGARGTDLEL